MQVNFLSQIRLSHKGDGPKVAKRLIDVYFALFKVFLDFQRYFVFMHFSIAFFFQISFALSSTCAVLFILISSNYLNILSFINVGSFLLRVCIVTNSKSI